MLLNRFPKIYRLQTIMIGFYSDSSDDTEAGDGE